MTREESLCYDLQSLGLDYICKNQNIFFHFELRCCMLSKDTTDVNILTPAETCYSLESNKICLWLVLFEVVQAEPLQRPALCLLSSLFHMLFVLQFPGVQKMSPLIVLCCIVHCQPFCKIAQCQLQIDWLNVCSLFPHSAGFNSSTF